MDKEKDRKEIAQIVVKYNCRPCGCADCDWSPENGSCDDYASYDNVAKEIVEAGYGNIKEAQIEILSKLKQIGVDRATHNPPLIIVEDIDSLIKELRGQ